ncbi:MAG: NAD-dependent epimerase/dehydratase family protein [Planctomycetota bacterium]
MARIFLTGGAGFIGSHTAEALLARGDHVVTLDNLNGFYDPAIKRTNVEALSAHDGFTFVEGDIRDAAAVAEAMDGADAVIHLAAMAGVRPSIEDPALYTDVNLGGTTLLLEAAVERGVGKFVFASSSSVYGERQDPPFSETDPVDHPISPYAATKKAGELLAHTFHALHGLPVACLRYFTVYGPRQRPEMAIHKFTRRILEGRPIPMFGDGSSARDYTFISDIVGGTVRALDGVSGYRVYNLGGSGVTTLARLIEVIAEAVGREAVIEKMPNQAGDVSLTSADVSRAKAELGYRPQVAIEEGVRRFVEWYRGTHA